jgi:hypothetical protein
MHKSILASIAAALIAFGATPAAAALAVGDTYVYRIVNAYNNETRGEVTYRVDKVDADTVTMAVTFDHPSLGVPHTDVFGRDDNWLRHPLINHDVPVEYNFSPAFPAYVAPLDPGKSWSMRVGATDPISGRRNSVRVDGDVVGTERISTPAGAFDTIKVKRRVYAGDWGLFTAETNIVETDWYAPALGRPVRTERNSSYMDPDKCGRPSSACTPVRGDWTVFELVNYSRK